MALRAPPQPSTPRNLPGAEVQPPLKADFGLIFADIVLPCTVEYMRRLLFMPSKLFDLVYKERSTTDVEIGDWAPGADGLPERYLAYTLALNYSFGPKSTRAEEEQRYACAAVPGMYYVIDTKVFTEHVPYGDNFYTAVRHVISYVSPKETRLKVCAEIRYRKGTPWSLTKTLIEKNSYSGLRSYWASCVNHLTRLVKEAASDRSAFEWPDGFIEQTIPIGADSVFRHSRRPSASSNTVPGATLDTSNMAREPLEEVASPNRSRTGSVTSYSSVVHKETAGAGAGAAVQPTEAAAPASTSAAPSASESTFAYHYGVRVFVFAIIVLLVVNIVIAMRSRAAASMLAQPASAPTVVADASLNHTVARLVEQIETLTQTLKSVQQTLTDLKEQGRPKE